MADLIELKNHEFEKIKNLIYEKVGINLTDQKKSLVIGRLQKILRTNHFNTFDEYYNSVISDTTGQALVTLVDRISTNHTFFYREFDHFQYFSEEIIRQIILKQSGSKLKKLRIWSAGCSSGEEPYTLAMLIRETIGNNIEQWDIGILATDISISVLEKARLGIYDNPNVENLPDKLKKKYLKKVSENEWQINDQIRKMIIFKRLNLMRNDFPFKGKFQVIFCRNVMIYFDNQTRNALVERFGRYTEPDGYLFIGHSETLGRTTQYFTYIKPAVYRKVAA